MRKALSPRYGPVSRQLVALSTALNKDPANEIATHGMFRLEDNGTVISCT